jgi:ribosomal protein S18 acetylase RimI-like enzyme
MQQFQTVSDSSCKDYSDSIAIYLEAFPKNERQTVEKLKSRIDTGHSKMLVAKSDGSVVGVSLLCNFKDLNFGLLDYMAVQKTVRNMGIGSKLFSKTYDLLEIDMPGGLLWLEVDDPAYGSPSEKTIRWRRIKFYQRLGTKIISDFKYFMPPINGDTPTNMLLMTYPGSKIAVIGHELLSCVLAAIYSKVYEKDKDDPYLCKMLQNIRGKNYSILPEQTDSNSLRSEII